MKIRKELLVRSGSFITGLKISGDEKMDYWCAKHDTS